MDRNKNSTILHLPVYHTGPIMGGYESHHLRLLTTLFSSGSKYIKNKVQNNVLLTYIAMQNKCLENMVAVKKLNANYIDEYNLVSGNNGY